MFWACVCWKSWLSFPPPGKIHSFRQNRQNLIRLLQFSLCSSTFLRGVIFWSFKSFLLPCSNPSNQKLYQHRPQLAQTNLRVINVEKGAAENGVTLWSIFSRNGSQQWHPSNGTEQWHPTWTPPKLVASIQQCHPAMASSHGTQQGHPSNGTEQWHPAMAPNVNSAKVGWYPAMAPSNGIQPWHRSNGTQQWHPSMAPSIGTQQWHCPSNGTEQWHPAMAP